MSDGNGAAARSLDGKRILVVRLSGLGDVVLTLPAVRALRRAYPRAHIAWLVADSCREALDGNPDLDEVLPVRLTSLTDRSATLSRRLAATRDFALEWCRMAAALRRGRYDVVVEFQNLLKCAAFTALNRRALRVGFRGGGEGTHLFLSRAPVRKDVADHSVTNYLRLAEALGAKAEPVEFPVAVPPEAERAAEEILGRAGVVARDRVVLLSPFARRETKLWDLGRFSEVAATLARTYGVRVLCAPGPADMPAAEALASRAPVALARGASLKVLCALLRRSTLFLGVDGGPMHLAGAVGTPVLAIYGPTMMRWIGPWGSAGGSPAASGVPSAVAVHIQDRLPCAPCHRRVCDHHSCMRGLPASLVLAAAERHFGGLLRGEVAPPPRPPAMPVRAG
ncbi:MAG: glycosyltransferase family 9 protein [Planctomycetales bacterium]|nr:glycosyltransferase family 9 protein [Planctomycetales bacterium]